MGYNWSNEYKNYNGQGMTAADNIPVLGSAMLPKENWLSPLTWGNATRNISNVNSMYNGSENWNAEQLDATNKIAVDAYNSGQFIKNNPVNTASGFSADTWMDIGKLGLGAIGMFDKMKFNKAQLGLARDELALKQDTLADNRAYRKQLGNAWKVR
jgi:hypothetical protein